jgi:hypothetical protein
MLHGLHPEKAIGYLYYTEHILSCRIFHSHRKQKALKDRRPYGIKTSWPREDNTIDIK